MTVFETMLDPGFRRRFLEKKRSGMGMPPEELESMSAYLLSEECTRHIQQLMAGDYFFCIPRLIKLRKIRSNRRRLLYRFGDKEIFLMKLMSYALHKYDYLYSPSLYSFRENKRSADLFEKIRRLPQRKQLYVLKADIHDYGGTVDPECLIRHLEKTLLPEDHRLLAFLTWLLSRQEYYCGDSLVRGSTGALSGTPLTAFLENIYLLAVDEAMTRHSVLYSRYCDDIAVFVRSREEAEAHAHSLSALLRERHLQFNEDKTVIYGPGEDVELLGIKITGDDFDISDHSMGKILWKMTHQRDKLLKRVQQKRLTKEAAMDAMIRFADRYFFGMLLDGREFNWVAWAFPILTRDRSLRQIDAHVQDCIRVVGSGKKTDARYRVTYKMMASRGYRTLVHAYHHGYQVTEVQYEATCCDPESPRGERSSDPGHDAGLP